MNPLQMYSFAGTDVRVVILDGEPWWIATDVCKILGIINGPDAVKRLDSDEISTIVLTDSGNLNKNRTIINESGLYSLVIRSDKPEARSFKKWITSVVIPSIRKTGSYTIVAPQTYTEALRALADSIDAKNKAEAALIEATPKAEKYDQFLDAGNLLSLDIAAKNLGIGRSRLTAELRDRKIFYKPTSNSVNHLSEIHGRKVLPG